MAYGEADLARKVQHVRPRCIVALLEFKDRHPVNEFQRIADLMPADTPAILALGDSDGAVPMFERPTDAQRLQVARHCAATTVDPNEVIGLIWTSGTTGFPKCAPRTHNNAIAYAGAVVEASFLKNRERTRILVPLSLAHTAGLGCYIPAWLMTGGLMVLHQPFNLDIYLDQLEEHRINATVAAPVMLNMILKENKLRGRDLSSLGAIMSGSAPLDAWVIDRFKREHGVTIVNSFGSTEGIAMATGPWMSDRLEEQATLYPRCVGSRLRPSAILENVDADMASDEQSWPFALAPGVEHKLVDIDTKEEIVEEHRPGELALKAPTVFAGYLTADFGLDRDDFDEDGFFRTGEIFEIVSGVKGPDFIHYIDRLKDVINRGGVKIPAGELNAVVNAHPALVEAAVIGAPDSHLGEQICVVAVLKEGESITLEHLNDFIRDAGVAKFMWPERLVLTDSLPRNPTGKVLKQKLRQLCNANAPVTCA
jgi:acyl-CoA synthetase (AMP-forming)/AMP-acid ligase II